MASTAPFPPFLCLQVVHKAKGFNKEGDRSAPARAGNSKTRGGRREQPGGGGGGGTRKTPKNLARVRSKIDTGRKRGSAAAVREDGTVDASPADVAARFASAGLVDNDISLGLDATSPRSGNRVAKGKAKAKDKAKDKAVPPSKRVKR